MTNMKEKFQKVEEEQRARVARQKKLEGEWLRNVLRQEEERKQRCHVFFDLRHK